MICSSLFSLVSGLASMALDSFKFHVNFVWCWGLAQLFLGAFPDAMASIWSNFLKLKKRFPKWMQKSNF
jgi:hypothetical protein